MILRVVHVWSKKGHITQIITDSYSMIFFDLYYKIKGWRRLNTVSSVNEHIMERDND